MSRKHLVEYYNEVNKQYYEFIEEIKDFEECAINGVVSPEVIDNIQNMLGPLKDNWQRMNYVMYLLNKPNKKEKIKKYDRQHSKDLKDCVTDKQVYEENNACIDEMKKLVDSMSKPQ